MYVYLHLPFCSSICSYCDFPKVLYDKKYIDRYLDCLEEEVKSRYLDEEVVSIFIGGGTPTALDDYELEKLLKITKIFQVKEEYEFTVESNVESLTEEKIKLLREYGVNRVSLGVQSFREEILRELNRHHDQAMVKDVVYQLKKYGIQNISMDYIYGVDSFVDGVREDIQMFLELDIPHISCYSLIVEDGTLLKIRGFQNIDDEIDREMYQMIERMLEEKGYIHYEISNYGKEGYFSCHNLNYWNNGEYYGFGLGAVSYLDSIRRMNTRNLSKYLEREYLYQEEKEDMDIRISNEFILGFRKLEGILISSFYQKYQKDIMKCYDVEELIHMGLLEIVDGYLRIPKRYIYSSNDILVHFV